MDLGNLGDLAGKFKEADVLPKPWQDVQGKDWKDLFERLQTARQNNEANPEDLNKVEHAAHAAQQDGHSLPGSLPELSGLLSKYL